MPFKLKEIYNQQFFLALCQTLKIAYPNFGEQNFLSLIFNDDWQEKELKQRMRHISFCLHQSLSNSYPQNLKILKSVAKNIDLQSKMSGLSLVIFADYVEAFGINDLEASLQALEFFTEFGSSEFAVRHFLVKYEQKTLERMLKWAKSDNYHIRRLATEGCRPRLPWGIALQKYKKDPTPILPILEISKDDKSDYVRRSVANNLNDIAKDNPEIAINLAEKWLKNADENLVRLTKHGLRHLLKKGDKRALRLFAINSNNKAKIELFDLQKTIIKIGENLGFHFTVRNQKQDKIRLEYAIYFLLKNRPLSKLAFSEELKGGAERRTAVYM